MIPIELNDTIKARIWLDDDVPNWSFDAEGETTPNYRVDTPKRKFSTRRRSAAVELLRTDEGRVSYGALGATFYAKDNEWLSIYVHRSFASSFMAEMLRNFARERGEKTSRYEEKVVLVDTLAKGLDTVYVALNRDGVEGVSDTLERIDLAHLFGSGTLRFPYGAYGRTTSSKEIFEQLTGIVLKLLVLNRKTLTPRILKNLLKRELFPAPSKEAAQPEDADLATLEVEE